MGKIVFEALEFYAYHGVFEEEKKIGSTYFIDLELDLDFTMAATSDDLAGTIDYGKIYGLLKTEMSKPSNLLEHVSGRIISMLFVTFKQIEHVKLKLTKMNPPIEGNVRSVSVVIEKARLE